jgi:tripartite-type tricarboxylate transporter receptor subunit TctC
MNPFLHRRALLLQAGATLLAVSQWPLAQAALGDKPVRLVVPFPAGGGTDVMGRLLAQSLSQELGATVIVDNVPGATGTLGCAQVARAVPDGHTLVLGISATHAIAPALFKDLKYRPDDFTAIARVAHGGNVLVAHPGYAANTAPEMVALVKRSREPLMYGSWGNGSGGHLAMESLRLATGIETVHVPYKGVAPLLQDVVGGQIQVAMADVAGALPLLRAGRIKALAVTGTKRSSALPEVPTLVQGHIAFDTESWFALFAPARFRA